MADANIRTESMNLHDDKSLPGQSKEGEGPITGGTIVDSPSGPTWIPAGQPVPDANAPQPQVNQPAGQPNQQTAPQPVQETVQPPAQVNVQQPVTPVVPQVDQFYTFTDKTGVKRVVPVNQVDSVLANHTNLTVQLGNQSNIIGQLKSENAELRNAQNVIPVVEENISVENLSDADLADPSLIRNKINTALKKIQDSNKARMKQTPVADVNNANANTTLDNDIRYLATTHQRLNSVPGLTETQRMDIVRIACVEAAQMNDNRGFQYINNETEAVDKYLDTLNIPVVVAAPENVQTTVQPNTQPNNQPVGTAVTQADITAMVAKNIQTNAGQPVVTANPAGGGGTPDDVATFNAMSPAQRVEFARALAEDPARDAAFRKHLNDKVGT